MSLKKRNKIFSKANILKLLVFYIAFYVLYYILALIFSSTFMQLFTLKEIGSADFTFNDLYYRVVASENFENKKNFRNPKSTILINTGSLSREEFRLQLSNLLLKLEEYEPAVIAVDHEFIADTNKIGTNELLETASYFGNIIFAYDPLSIGYLEPEGLKGKVMFPAQTSIRYYRNSDSSFAFVVAKRLSQKLKEPKNRNDSFPIHYSSYAKGFTHWQDKIDQYYDINFKAVEAVEFFENNDSSQIEELKKLVAGKAVILGHLGSPDMNNSNDIEDKFRVPVDPMAMTGREKIMPGPVIHANAVENFLHTKEMFFELKGFWFIFLQQLLYFFYLAFVLFEKFGNVTKKIALGILSVISFIVVIKLMSWGVYVTMGTTLLQLLIIEEITEMFEPYYAELEKYFKIRKDEND